MSDPPPARPDHSDLVELEGLLRSGRLLTDSDLKRAHEVPERGKPGIARFVAVPGDVSEVSAVAAWAFHHQARLVTQGANTGLVGASTPDETGTQGVLSMGRLDGILDVAVADRTVVVESGVRLDELNEQLAADGLFLPIEMGANPSVGGMAATNAAGARTIRYGDMARRVVGIEGVLADESGSTIGHLGGIKDNSRLRIGRLLLGSFGALGVITRLALRVAPTPAASCTAVIALRSPHDAPSLLTVLEQRFAERLSAFEFMDRAAVEVAVEGDSAVYDPLSEVAGACRVLIEVGDTGSNPALELALAETVDGWAEDPAAGVIETAIVPPSQAWALRHSLTDAFDRAGAVMSFDVSVPRASLPTLYDAVRESLVGSSGGPTIAEFGHWGSGGTHLKLLYRDGELPADAAAIRERVFDLVVREFAGSFSAEHGIGPHNAQFYERYVPAHQRELEHRTKALLDPRNVWGRAPYA